MSEELKPCPLCGGQVKEEWSEVTEYRARPPHQVGYVECEDCGIDVTMVEGDPDSDNLGDKLRTKWNTRADESQLSRLKSKLREVELSNQSLKMRLKDTHDNFIELSKQAAAQSAHIEKLKAVASSSLACAKEPFGLKEEFFKWAESVIRQSPATSLAQMEIDDAIRESGGIVKDESKLWQCLSRAAYGTSNNLKEQG